MNEVIVIQQKINDFTTTIKVDETVKRFEVEFNGSSTKVTKVVVELKENKKNKYLDYDYISFFNRNGIRNGISLLYRIPQN